MDTHTPAHPHIHTPTHTRILLASASPRRQELLRNVGVAFEVQASDVDERVGEMPPEEMVVHLARQKATAVAGRLVGIAPDAPYLVIGADTVVVCGEEVLGKPEDAEDARRMLRLLSGSEHRVLTGIHLILAAGAERPCAEGCEETLVRFAPLQPSEIEGYVATGEPLDKAGAYGIQGRAAFFVEGITGCYFNVVGLPLSRLYALAHRLGVDVLKG